MGLSNHHVPKQRGESQEARYTRHREAVPGLRTNDQTSHCPTFTHLLHAEFDKKMKKKPRVRLTNDMTENHATDRSVLRSRSAVALPVGVTTSGLSSPRLVPRSKPTIAGAPSQPGHDLRLQPFPLLLLQPRRRCPSERDRMFYEDPL